MKATTLSISFLILLAAYATPGSAQSDPVEVQQLLPEDINFEHQFGYAAAISNEFAMVGAPEDNGQGGIASGTVRVYRKVAGEWVEFDKLEPAHHEDAFGTSVAISGDWAIVGAPDAEGDNVDLLGKVYFFHWNGEEWMETQVQAPLEEITDYNYGTDVAMSGNVAIVYATGGTDFRGTVHIYRRGGEVWEEEALLQSPDGNFSASVAICGDFALVSQVDSEAGTDAGAVHCLRRVAGTWQIQQKLLGKSEFDNFGWSVALQDNLAVITAPFAGNNQGTVYFYERSGNNWVEVDSDRPSDVGDSDLFGISVAMDGDLVAIGTEGFDPNPPESDDRVYLYRRSGGEWIQQPTIALDVETDETFGWAVGVSGSLVIVGTSTAPNTSGAADPSYIFDARIGSRATINNFTIKRGELVSGNVERLRHSDNKRLSIESEFTPGGEPPYLMILDVKLTTNVNSPSVLHLIVEGKLDQNDGTAKLLLYDWTLGKWKRVRSYSLGRAEKGMLVLDLDAGRYVRGDGLIKARIRQEKVTSSNGDPFVSSTDQVEALVR